MGLDHRRFLAIQTDEHKANIAEIDGRRTQKMRERDTITHHCKDRGGNCTAPAAELVYVGYFYEQQVGPQLTYLSEFQDLVEQEHDLLVQQSRRRDAEDATLQSAQHSDRFSSVLHDRWSEPFDVPIFASRGPRIRSSMKSTSQAEQQVIYI